MAPERLKRGPATAKSDLWSLGLTLATAALGENPISQANGEFAQMSLAERAQRTIKREKDLSPELTDFLCQCLARDPADRPALSELMDHEFLNQRHEWQIKCPEVARAMRARKRRQREDANFLSTASVLDALCQARAGDNLRGPRLVDTSTAADLAYELGVTSKSLVRNVLRRTKLLVYNSRVLGTIPGIGADGGCNGIGGNGVSDGGNSETRVIGCAERSRRGSNAVRSVCDDGGGGEGVGTGDVVGKHEDEGDPFDDGCPFDDSEDDLSPMSPQETPCDGHDRDTEGGGHGEDNAAPVATVSCSRSSPGCSPSSPVATWTPKIVAGVGAGGGFLTPRYDGVMAKTPVSRRAREVPSIVKLTPHKRRGERKKRSSRTKRELTPHAKKELTPHAKKELTPHAKKELTPHGRKELMPHTKKELVPQSKKELTPRAKKELSPNRSSKDWRTRHREREERPHEPGGGEGGVGVGGRSMRSGRKTPKRQEEVPRTAVSRMLPSRSEVLKSSTRCVYNLADSMKKEIKLKDRIHHLRVYKGCFSGREAVQWMVKGRHATSVHEAVTLGNEMMKAGVFEHISNSHLFEDSSVYYQFTDGQELPPPASGGRRVGQMARVVLAKIVKGVVGSKGEDEFEASLQDLVNKSANSMSDSGLSRSNSHRTTSSFDRATSDKKIVLVEGAKPPRPIAYSAPCQPTGGSAVGVPAFLSKKQPLHGSSRPPRVPTSSMESKSSRRRRQSSGSSVAVSQLRRFSSSISTATVPETPY